jgi:hypothetical protein
MRISGHGVVVTGARIPDCLIGRCFIAGDYDLMNPLFKMYMSALPLRKAAPKNIITMTVLFFLRQ